MSCFSCISPRRKDVRDYDEDMAPRSADSANGRRGGSVGSKLRESMAQKTNVARSFTFKELAMATQNFREANLIGEGGFGCVYKGRLESGMIVAIKQLNLEGLQGNQEFIVEVLMLSLLHHPNLVNLIGYCTDGDQRLLVYEYMPMGSLEYHLFDLDPGKEPLSWSTRLKIAVGAARGLKYLHCSANPPVIYRDLKSSNILLDNDFNPKLSDFGLAKLGPVGDKTHVSTRVMGTYGYCAPEYAMSGKLTLKSDIYSFGVVLLELITGRKAIDCTRKPGEQNLVVWGEKALKATDTVHGSSLDIGPTTPLPDKNMLVFVLDRLQKKDTYGAFSEPADPNELPDYHEIIEHPMDFWTLRKKLDAGCYSNLEELEADVLLLCSNAMQYNAPDTIYFRQARAIRELAKWDFENLRNEGDNGEPQPKVIRRGRPPSKNLKKPLESSPVDRVGHELSSGATLASAEDKAIGSNGYNLRKGPAFYRFRSNDAFGTSYRSRNGENYSDWLVDWNSEFPASILRADMKYGKKHFSAVDENRRDTYKQFHPSTSSSNESYLWNSFGDMKRLLPVGLHLEPQAYARSLARYAANLGPVAWNVASRKLKTALPDGLAFGPGWVEENDAPQQLLSSAEKLKQANGLVHDRDPSRPVTPSSSGLSTAVAHRPSPEMAEAVRRMNCQNELAEQASGSPWATAGAIFQAQHKSLFHPNRNGFSSMFGCDPPSQVGLARQTIQAGQSGLEGCSISDQMLGVLSTGDVSALRPVYQGNSEEIKLSENRGASQRGNLLGQASDSHVPAEVGMTARCLQAQHRQPLAVPPDLNVRVQASASPSSSLQIGSPQQPDLALQL